MLEQVRKMKEVLGQMVGDLTVIDLNDSCYELITGIEYLRKAYGYLKSYEAQLETKLELEQAEADEAAVR
jgi:hypothetical protein